MSRKEELLVKFFKTLSSLIRLEREQLTSLQEELDQLK